MRLVAQGGSDITSLWKCGGGLGEGLGACQMTKDVWVDRSAMTRRRRKNPLQAQAKSNTALPPRTTGSAQCEKRLIDCTLLE